jgi:heme-degrading monooxygenase HmoA
VTEDAPGHPPFEPGHVITIFRSRRRPERLEAYLELMVEIEAAARAMDGFVDVKGFGAEDGERVTLVTFASPETHKAWRDEPRHRAAQRRGRDEFYLEYSVQVGECAHVSQWRRDDD